MQYRTVNLLLQHRLFSRDLCLHSDHKDRAMRHKPNVMHLIDKQKSKVYSLPN